MTVLEYLAECTRRGLVPGGFTPTGETDHELMVSITCRAQMGLQEKHGSRVPEVPYAAKGQRGTVLDIDDQLTHGAYTSPDVEVPRSILDLETEAGRIALKLDMARRRPRDLPKGDAWEAEAADGR